MAKAATVSATNTSTDMSAPFAWPTRFTGPAAAAPSPDEGTMPKLNPPSGANRFLDGFLMVNAGSFTGFHDGR